MFSAIVSASVGNDSCTLACGSRLGPEILADIGLAAQEGPSGLQRVTRPIKIPHARRRQGLAKRGGALDGVLDRPMGRVERRDRVLL
jgi:hypothetical protein